MRNLTQLINDYKAIANENEYTKFVDDISIEEAGMLSRAKDVGLCTRIPAYIIRRELNDIESKSLQGIF
jgi:hypothetical protein